ncbi:MAG TPA: short-chain dehydrogenase [Actinobacteria bacterium]|nr:short-chain dehydrogenase [Actinomycetota bacterium]
MKIDLTNKTAVVTGATGELGRTIVRSMAECGADVGICYFNKKDYADELKDEIRKKYSVKAVAVWADITDFDSVISMKNEIFQSLGTTDIIVNNAVIQINWKNILEQNPEDYESQFKSCVMQNVYMAKAFVPDMMKQNYGRVIGINTECSMQNFVTQSAYVSGKRGMDGVLRVLAREVGRYNITVNQVAPGWILTEGCRNADGSEKNTNQDFPYIERLPLGRRVTDIEVANAVCFLASDLAASITGVYLPVCSGNVMPSI